MTPLAFRVLDQFGCPVCGKCGERTNRHYANHAVLQCFNCGTFFPPVQQAPPSLPKAGDRVFSTHRWFDRGCMQVCVLPNTSNEEILNHCNNVVPLKDGHRWKQVINTKLQAFDARVDSDSQLIMRPAPCRECPGRIHKCVISL